MRSLIVFNFTANITRNNVQAIQARRASGAQSMINYVRNVSASLSGFVTPTPLPPVSFSLGNQQDFAGVFQHVAEARKWVLTSQGRCIVPTIQYLSAKATPSSPQPAILLFTNRVKALLSLQEVALVDALCEQGYNVVVADLCGLGEAGFAFDTTDFGKGNGGCEQMAAELGGSIPGWHAADVLRVAAFVNTLPEVKGIAGTISFNHTMTAVMLASIFGDGQQPLGKLAIVESIASFSECSSQVGAVEKRWLPGCVCSRQYIFFLFFFSSFGVADVLRLLRVLQLDVWRVKVL